MENGKIVSHRRDKDLDKNVDHIVMASYKLLRKTTELGRTSSSRSFSHRSNTRKQPAVSLSS